MNRKEYSRKYYLEHREQVRARVKEYRQARPEWVKADHREWYEKNGESIREKRHKQYAANPDSVKNRSRKWYEKNRELIKGKRKKQYEENRKEAIAKSTRWKKENHDAYLTSCRLRNQRRRLDVLTAYGGKCACCEEGRPEFLAIDHINNDGAKDRRGGGHWYGYLLRYHPTDVQILCHNCNMAKAIYGICPHVRDGIGETTGTNLSIRAGK